MANAKSKVASWIVTAVCVVLTAGCQKVAADYSDHWKGAIPSEFEQIPTLEMVPAYKAAAYAGSGPAANALSTYYLKSDRAGEQDLYWRTISAENGDPVGQYSLAMIHLKQDGAYYSQRRGLYWLQKSAAQGHELAKKSLAELQSTAHAPVLGEKK